MINILLVDDLYVNREDLKSRLKTLNFEINIFESVNEKTTFEILNKKPIDIILLDIVLNNESGIEICEKIRKNKNTENIIIIMITAYGELYNLKEQVLDAGADSYLTRPFNTPDLISQINIAIRLKKAEDALRIEKNILEYGLSLSEKKYKDLFSTMTSAFSLHEVLYNNKGDIYDYVFLEVNNAFEKLTGLHTADVVGKKASEIYPDMYKIWLKVYSEVIQTKKTKSVVEQLKNVDKWIEVSIYAQNKKFFITVFNDVTESIENNKKINKIHKELDQILNASSPLCVVNKECKMILVNDSFCNLFKVDRDVVLDKPCQNIFGLHTCKNNCPIKRILTGTKKSSYEIYTKVNKNKSIKCLVTAKPYENDQNKIIGMVKTFTDITRLKKVEKKLINAKNQAEESDRLKSAFLANMSHEIRTPMNSIIGFSDLLNEENIDKPTKENYLNIIQNAGNDLLKLIDDIIDIAKIEAGQIKLKIENVSLKKMISDLYVMYNKNSNLIANNVKLKLIDSDKICDNILTDELRVKQIIINLLNNAIKFTHNGEIEFGYYLDGAFIQFFVKDTGIGLTKEQIKVIWERFRQADDSTTKKYGGAGLGLSISKGIVNLFGGKIWAESEMCKGTIFYFTIPYNPTIKKSIEIEEKLKHVIYDWENKTILVAEDVDLNYQLIEKLLDDTNVDLIRAKNGYEAIKLYKQHKNIIDVILMDIQMPEMNGYDAIKKINKINKNIPIIAQTAYAMNDEIKKCFILGCSDVIKKPIIKRNMIESINKYINIRKNS
jgi:two-component system CheB/CheR fusion protein